MSDFMDTATGGAGELPTPEARNADGTSLDTKAQDLVCELDSVDGAAERYSAAAEAAA